MAHRDSPVQRWVASASIGVSNSDDDDDREGDSGELSWEDAIRDSRRKIITSKLSIRMKFLRDELLPLIKKSDLPAMPMVSELVKVMFQTIPRYEDSQSREAVLTILGILIKKSDASEGPLKSLKATLVKWICQESEKLCNAQQGTSSSAPSTRLGFLAWTCKLVEIMFKEKPPTEIAASSPLINNLGVLISSFQDPDHIRPAVQKSAMVMTRRVIRNNHDRIPALFDLLSQPSSPVSNAGLLGVVIDVSLRLRVGKETSKGAIDGVGVGYVITSKDRILQWWISQVLGSRTALPAGTTMAFRDFCQRVLTSEDFSSHVAVSSTKLLLRSPEAAMPSLTLFLKIFPHPITSEVQLQFLPSILSSSKSSNLETRKASLSFFACLFRDPDPDVISKIVEEISSPLKTGKTSSPDHRALLLNMLACLKPNQSFCPILLKTCCEILIKETHEGALTALRTVIGIQLQFLITSGIEIDSSSIQAISKSMQDSKPLTRKVACQALGYPFWQLQNAQHTDHAINLESVAISQTFQTSLANTIEINLKNASTNPLASTAGPLEGYIAVVLCNSPLLRYSTSFQALWKSNPVLTSLTASSPKPNFLYMDRLYRKSTATPDESQWHVRALDSVFEVIRPQLGQDEAFRTAFAQTILFYLIESTEYETRRLALELVCRWFKNDPHVICLTLLHGLRSQLSDNCSPHDPQNKSVGARLRFLWSSLFKQAREIEINLRSRLLVDCFVVSHHELIDNSEAFWIGLVRATSLDPKELISSNFETLNKCITESLNNSFKPETGLSRAAYRAATTLCLVVPDLGVPEVVGQIMELLDPEKVAFIGSFELGVWGTPVDQAFVDVLSSQKKDTVQSKNPRDDSIEKWELELRQAIEKKKAGGTRILSKAEQALVDAQLAKEAQARKSIDAALVNLKRGFYLIHSLILALKGSDEVITDYAASIVDRCLKALQTEAVVLVPDEGYMAFTILGNICTEKLGQSRSALTRCILRGLGTNVIPKEMTIESLPELVTRVLYKVRSLAEQQAIDCKTYSYLAPLLSKIIENRGIGLEAAQVEEALEQIALVVDIMSFAGPEAIKMHDLRSKIIKDCLAVISGYPQLIKAATTALITVGSAMASDASDGDIHTMCSGFLYSEAQARYAALQSVQNWDMIDLEWSPEVWVACHDDDERNASLALDLWVENGLRVPATCLKSLLGLLEHRGSSIRNAAAKAIAEAAKEHPQLAGEALSAIALRYEFLARELVPEYDQYGMIIPESLGREDPWQYRVAQANAMCHLAPFWKDDSVLPLFDFLVKHSLGDRNENVRTSMLAVGNAAIDLHGAHHLEELIAMLEAILANGSLAADFGDYITEAAVLLLGRLARHLSTEDTRLTNVIDRLVDALNTPSEAVQSAVSDCLPPLIRLRKDRVPILIQRLLEDTLNSSKYAGRRGAAYGLAGAIKGRGITSIREFSIVDRLRDGLEDKKNTRARQGALFAIEILAGSLGRLFEPYLIQTTSILLTAFGDSASEIREAIQDTARAIMRGLSGHAVKLILPSLLIGLDDKQWRTKKGAIELMGAMAYLAPKQLSMSLPTIIPRLTEVLTDTHAQVRAAANSSLKKFGDVVSNPEISSMQDVLLAALVDPARKTGKALDSLLGTAFVHYVDTSSLALVVPIIERGLRERSADIKRKATQIVGNLATLTEAKDLSPYLPQLMPKVRQVLVDPVPEARATAAKALGSLVERLGEESFPELVPSLLATLQAEVPGVDQQGAAQGLSEIMSGLGTDKLDELLPEIIASTSSVRSYVREGFISLLIFLPATYGDRFSPYLGRIIRPVLNGLADDSDYVRDASMRAGRMIVTNHSTKAIELLLPELEQGIFNESWRIRQSSVQLLGDLLFRISGIAAKADLGNDDGEEDELNIPSAETSRIALVDALGRERRDRVLAAIYIIRQDSSGVVRSTSVHIWKALVNNTPKTVREIMPSLMQILIRTLASNGGEQQETAARTLGELVKKLGENILSTITTILQKAVSSDDVRIRQGVSLAITDVIESISQTQLEDNQGPLAAIVRTALVDSDSNVRTTAARAFDALQQRMGGKAVEETLPTLLNALRQPGSVSEAALAALKELMRVGASSILPRLLPVLTKTPINAFNARALAGLTSVAGGAITKYLPSVVDSFNSCLLVEEDQEVREALDSSMRTIFESLDEPESINCLMMHLLGLSKSETPYKRSEGCNTFAIFCTSNSYNRSEYHALWVRQLVCLLDDPVSSVIDSAWTALDEMVKTIPKSEMDGLVIPLRRTIENFGIAGRLVPGLCRPSGLKPFMPILLQGILAGTVEQREQAALALGNLVERTSQEHVKPYVTQMTGPLIRVIGDRFPAPVKSAILQTLGVLLLYIPQFVKPFFPQLQRTFVKSVGDVTSVTVRNKAVTALGLLMKHQIRVDPLITELLGTLRTLEYHELQDSIVSALAAVVAHAGAHVTDGPIADLVGIVKASFHTRPSDSMAAALSRLVAALAQAQASHISPLLDHIIANPPTPLASLCARELVEHAGSAVYELGFEEDLVTFIFSSSAAGQPPNIARPAREAKELLKIQPNFVDDVKIQNRF